MRSNVTVLFATLLSAGLFALSAPAAAEKIGSVDTAFQWFGKNHKIEVEVFEDPKVSGVVCHLSRPVTGGFMGSMGLAEDKSDASIACRQVGPITIKGPLKENESVFSKDTSVLFKTMQVVRMHDKKYNVLVYLVYSDKMVDGSPKNSISTVPVMPWGATQPN